MKKGKKPLPFTDKGLYELDPEPTPEQRAAMNPGKQFEAFLCQLDGLEYLPFQSTAKKLENVKAAHPLLAALEAAKTPAARKAAQAAIDGDAVASEVQRRLARFKEADANANAYELDTFRAGYEFAFAYLLATAGAAARRGKPMLKGAEAAKRARAERGTRSKKENLLKSAIQDAYEIFLEDPNTYQADKTKTYFAFNWLVSKCEEFEIVFDAWEGKDGLYRHTISGDEVTPGTARRWVK